MAKRKKRANRYVQLFEPIFLEKHTEGATQVTFERDDMVRWAKKLRIKLPKNLGDVPYTFRYRADLPSTIRDKAPAGHRWIIRGVGRAKYCFALTARPEIVPNDRLLEIKIPDATPGVIGKYALTDEQALLAKLRYNRLIDLFTSLTCYSLQSHLRTAVSRIGQMETDELYVGIDRSGAHFIVPVQAKGGSDRISEVQIEQDLAMCEEKFAGLICRPIGAQFMRDDLIALFEFIQTDGGVAIAGERHYRLVPPEDISADDLRAYREHMLNVGQ